MSEDSKSCIQLQMLFDMMKMRMMVQALLHPLKLDRSFQQSLQGSHHCKLQCMQANHQTADCTQNNFHALGVLKLCS